jgi:hypothetical protein
MPACQIKVLPVDLKVDNLSENLIPTLQFKAHNPTGPTGMQDRVGGLRAGSGQEMAAECGKSVPDIKWHLKQIEKNL